jgi:hypothetical protein
MTDLGVLSVTLDTRLTLFEMREEVLPAPQPRRWQVRGDEELKEWNYQSRTNHPSWKQPYACTPSVYRFYRDPIDKQGDFRVDISPLRAAIVDLNGGDMQKVEYLFNSGTGIFNTTGYPMQAYTTMSGNELIGERVGDFLRFETLTPASNVAGMTISSHPYFVHRFDLVCWSARTKETYHKPVRWGWEVYWFLVTAEGFAWMPLRHVREV